MSPGGGSATGSPSATPTNAPSEASPTPTPAAALNVYAGATADKLSETVKGHAHEILSRQDVQKLIDKVKETDKAVVDELIPALTTVGGVQKVLRERGIRHVAALSDIGFNMLGFLLGWLGGMVSGNSMRRLAQRHLNLHGADRFALVMIVLWLAAELFPFIPTFDVSSVVDNVKSLWQQDFWQPRRMLLHMGMTVIGLEALARLVRENAKLRDLLLGAIADIGDLQARIEAVNMRFDE